MSELDDWEWGIRPESDEEFEAMMASLDAHLARKGLLPHQRPFRAKARFALLLDISVPLAGSILGIGATESCPEIQRVGDWFKAMYGERLNPHFHARSFVMELRGTLWRMRLGMPFGSPTLFMDKDLTNRNSVLGCIDGFSQAFADRLKDAELDSLMTEIEIGFPAIEALDGFSGSDLFDLARLDYEHGVDALVSGIAWSKARWDTAQTAEKVLKGMLNVARQPYPKGRDGHIIPSLGELVRDYYEIDIPTELLEAIDCKPAVRYGEEEATRESAMAAHRALLQMLPILFEAFVAFRNGKPPT